MKTWPNITCLTCKFRHSPSRFTKNTLEPVRFPVQIVTGGGRARGFHVKEYIAWPDINKLRAQPQVWEALNSEYILLSSAYDNFYDYLHYLSPRMQELVDSLNREVFRLRVQCRELQDRLDRLLLTNSRGRGPNEFGRILEAISRREEEDRRSARDILK